MFAPSSVTSSTNAQPVKLETLAMYGTQGAP